MIVKKSPPPIKKFKFFFKGVIRGLIRDHFTDVLDRKFCDIAQGLIGKPLILQKGIPLYGGSIVK